MNPTLRKITVPAYVILGAALMMPSAWAENSCHNVQGQIIQVVSDTTSTTFSGPVTKAGHLNGTAASTFFGPPFPTNEPNTFSFTFNMTITTRDGALQAQFVNLFDNGTGVNTAQGRIDPNARTGRFAGVTGILFLNGTTSSSSPFTVQLDLSGKICNDRELE